MSTNQSRVSSPEHADIFSQAMSPLLLRQAVPLRAFSGWSLGLAQGSNSKIECGGMHAFAEYKTFDSDASKIKVTEQSVFDIASLTKAFTAILMLHAISESLIALDDPITKYIETLRADGDVPTIRDFLSFGVIFDLDHLKSPYTQYSVEHILSEIRMARIRRSGFKYSNYAPMILAMILEKIHGMPIDSIVSELLTGPLAMKNTKFLKPGMYDPRHTVRTTFMNGHLIETVQDPLARRLWPMPIGAAGIFSNASDLLQLARLLLSQGSLNGRQFIKPELVQMLGQNQLEGRGNPGSGLGFGLVSELVRGYSQTRLQRLTGSLDRSYFRSAYTGCLFVIAPELDAAMVLLTNFVHPQPKDGKWMQLFRHVMVSAALCGELVGEAQELLRTSPAAAAAK